MAEFQTIAFVTSKGVILASGEAKNLDIPEIKKNFDRDMVIGKKYTKSVPRSIPTVEVSMTLKDLKRNPVLKNFIEQAFSNDTIVTLMILNAEQSTINSAGTSDAAFYLGYLSLPSRSITTDKADESTMTMELLDAWRTERGIVVWRLDNEADSNVTIEAVYG
jgi:hypothetical protein